MPELPALLAGLRGRVMVVEGGRQAVEAVIRLAEGSVLAIGGEWEGTPLWASSEVGLLHPEFRPIVASAFGLVVCGPMDLLGEEILPDLRPLPGSSLLLWVRNLQEIPLPPPTRRALAVADLFLREEPGGFRILRCRMSRSWEGRRVLSTRDGSAPVSRYPPGPAPSLPPLLPRREPRPFLAGGPSVVPQRGSTPPG